MSNIHRLGDFENNNNRPNAGGNGRGAALLGGGPGGNGGDARKENFCSFLRNICCPYSTIKSVIFFVTITDIIVYFITLSFGIGLSTPEHPMLLPPLEKTLDVFGDLVRLYILTNRILGNY